MSRTNWVEYDRLVSLEKEARKASGMGTAVLCCKMQETKVKNRLETWRRECIIGYVPQNEHRHASQDQQGRIPELHHRANGYEQNPSAEEKWEHGRR
jgi:hypothetical protein